MQKTSKTAFSTILYACPKKSQKHIPPLHSEKRKSHLRYVPALSLLHLLLHQARKLLETTAVYYICCILPIQECLEEVRGGFELMLPQRSATAAVTMNAMAMVAFFVWLFFIRAADGRRLATLYTSKDQDAYLLGCGGCGVRLDGLDCCGELMWWWRLISCLFTTRYMKRDLCTRAMGHVLNQAALRCREFKCFFPRFETEVSRWTRNESLKILQLQAMTVYFQCQTEQEKLAELCVALQEIFWFPCV